jgi:protein TonB
MERPVLIAGESEPQYPRNALLQHREGTVIINCRITTDGSVRDCSILSGDVMLQQAALDTVIKQRYRPLIYEGVPVSVWYKFRFTFKMQH